MEDERTGETLPVTPASYAAEVKLAEMNPQAERSRTASSWIEHFAFCFLLHKGDKHISSKELMHTLALRTQWRAGTASITNNYTALSEQPE